MNKFWKKTTSCHCWQSLTSTICPRKYKINPWFPSWPPNSFHWSKSSKIGKLLFLWMTIAGLLCIMQSRPMMLRLQLGSLKRGIRISKTILATLPCSKHWDLGAEDAFYFAWRTNIMTKEPRYLLLCTTGTGNSKWCTVWRSIFLHTEMRKTSPRTKELCSTAALIVHSSWSKWSPA